MHRVLLILALLLASCAGGPFDAGGKPATEAPPATYKTGVVESVTPVELDASSGGGSSLGGLFGQVGGSNTGGGRGAVVGTILGGVLGSTLGHQSGIATRPGLEIWVKLDNEEGKSAYVMQPGKPDEFKVGDRVRVLRKGSETRVVPEPAPLPNNTPKEPAKDAPKEPPKP